jgi:metal-dependent hydrolase (beta-lactamase superfamily II)
VLEAPEWTIKRLATADGGLDHTIMGLPGGHVQWQAGSSLGLDAIATVAPRYVMPGHCTGWAATHQVARAMPGAFIANSVGTTLLL